MCIQQNHLAGEGQEVACGQDEIVEEYVDFDAYHQQAD